MNKEVVIRFDESAYKEYRELQDFVAAGKLSRKKPTYSQLLSSIDNAISNIRVNPYHGDLIPRKYLSKAAISRYGTDKILRVELIGYWRLLYTLIGEEVRV